VGLAETHSSVFLKWVVFQWLIYPLETQENNLLTCTSSNLPSLLADSCLTVLMYGTLEQVNVVGDKFVIHTKKEI
jgi:hypothetical protein